MKSLEELAKIREEAKRRLELREGTGGPRLVIAMGTCGIAAGARETLMAVLDELGKRNLANVTVTQTGCVGLCEQEPLMEVIIPGQPKVTYGRVDANRARQIIASHIVNGNIIGDWVVARE